MRFFLRYVNPLLALTVMVICFFSATGDRDGTLTFFEDNFCAYFLAKGIFCGTALFLLGKLVEQGISPSSPRAQPPNDVAESSPPEP